jgi:hypothetical protein
MWLGIRFKYWFAHQSVSQKQPRYRKRKKKSQNKVNRDTLVVVKGRRDCFKESKLKSTALSIYMKHAVLKLTVSVRWTTIANKPMERSHHLHNNSLRRCSWLVGSSSGQGTWNLCCFHWSYCGPGNCLCVLLPFGYEIAPKGPYCKGLVFNACVLKVVGSWELYLHQWIDALTDS